MKTQDPISVGLCLQIMIDTIEQDCLLDYLAEPQDSNKYITQKQRFQRLKTREKINPTTIKNLTDFAKFEKEWAEWLIGDGYSNTITMNYVDRFLIRFTEAAQLQIPVGNILYIATYSICYVIWETLLNLFEQDKNQSQEDLIRATLSIFDFFDSDSEYQKNNTIFKKVFWYLDQLIDRWINGDQNPSWNYVKWICNEEFLPSKELFKQSEGVTERENEPEELWKFFRQRFLLAYFINNFLNSLENKQKMITTEQKEYLVSSIRYMFRFAFYPNDDCFLKSSVCEAVANF